MPAQGQTETTKHTVRTITIIQHALALTKMFNFYTLSNQLSRDKDVLTMKQVILLEVSSWDIVCLEHYIVFFDSKVFKTKIHTKILSHDITYVNVLCTL